MHHDPETKTLTCRHAHVGLNERKNAQKPRRSKLTASKDGSEPRYEILKMYFKKGMHSMGQLDLEVF